jgi:hypothetical protein
VGAVASISPRTLLLAATVLEVDYAAMDIAKFCRLSFQQPLPGVAGAG